MTKLVSFFNEKKKEEKTDLSYVLLFQKRYDINKTKHMLEIDILQIILSSILNPMPQYFNHIECLMCIKDQTH